MKKKHMTRFMIALSCLLTEISSSQTIKTFSYDAEQLSKYWITPYMLFNNIYPDTTIFPELPAQEVVLALNEDFIVELTHCSMQEQWSYGIEDSAMILIQDDTMVTDSTKTLSYEFGASKACKGSIVFYDSNSGNQRELVVEYTCDPVDSLELSLTHQDWLADTSSPASLLLLYVSGKTNASKVKVETYGDGIIGAAVMYPDNNGNFSDTVGIAFSYDPTHQHIPKCNTRIALYGAVGFPKVLTILYNSPTLISRQDDNQALKRFDLYQNYPNPFNPTTTINYQIPRNGLVTLKVFDVLGREVETLVSESETAGAHSVRLNATNLPSGVYFYRLEAGTYHDTKKFLMLR